MVDAGLRSLGSDEKESAYDIDTCGRLVGVRMVTYKGDMITADHSHHQAVLRASCQGSISEFGETVRNAPELCLASWRALGRTAG